MRKLIRASATKAFLMKDGNWTQNIDEALQIEQNSECAAIKEKFQLQGVELYYNFSDTFLCHDWDFGHPI